MTQTSEFKAKITAELDTSKVEQQLKDLRNKDTKLKIDTSNTQGQIKKVDESLQGII